MKAASLEQHFSTNEIEILEEITATQVRAEISGQDLVVGNPYRGGMRTWVEKYLTSDDAAFMAKSLEIAAKYDNIPDQGIALHRALIERVMSGM